MGQYYKVVNTTKKQTLSPYAFGSGAKLMEFTSDGGTIMQGLGILLADGNGRGSGDLNSNNKIVGSWAGDSIVIAGDYADEGRFTKHENNNLYEESKGYKDVSLEVIEALMDDNYWEDEFYRKWKARGFNHFNDDIQNFSMKRFADRMANELIKQSLK
jgi:hypothetical protein